MTFDVYVGDCRSVLADFDPNTFEAIVTDPPYGLGFMGKGWDHGVPGVEFWHEVLRVMRPGGHIVAFGGTRTYHRLTVAMEDAGLEIRDCLMWLYGSGFPKSLDVSKAIDKAAGAEREVVGLKVYGEGQTFTGSKAGGRSGGAMGAATERAPSLATAPATESAQQWEGWGTALKPAWEPIILARKPLAGTVAANVLEHGVGALHIDACRVEGVPESPGSTPPSSVGGARGAMAGAMDRVAYDPSRGRWPANVVLDEAAAALLDEQTGHLHSRFYYTAKASKRDRTAGGAVANDHPTVKPTALMRWLVRLITPPGAAVLDPFMGSGSTGVAALEEGHPFVGIDQDEHYVYDVAEPRLRIAAGLAADPKAA